MTASWTASRRGQGAVVIFVIWVIAIALVYALSQSQAQGDALSIAVRVIGLRSIHWAGRSALNEVAFRISRKPESGQDALEVIHQGGTPSPLEPALTREVYAPAISRGEIAISEVEVKLIGGTHPQDSTDPWYFDMSVSVEYRAGRARLSRTLRRRYVARQFPVRLTLGPGAPKILSTGLTIQDGYLFEVME